MEVIGKNCKRDSTSIDTPPENFTEAMTSDLSGMKIGVPRSSLSGLNDEMSALFHNSLEKLKECGAELVDIDLDLLKYSIGIYYILATAEASTNLARFDGVRYGVRSEKAKSLDEVYAFSKNEGFGPEVKRRILLGTYVLSSGYQDAYYRHAQRVRRKLINQFKNAFQACSIIAMPVTSGPAFKLGEKKNPLEEYLEDLYTIAANLAGLPAISVPGGFSKEGLPVGLQLMGPQLADVNVCRTAYAYEQATRHGERLPEMVTE
jgi:aspartyl-tRNA(Asn)/glutamyl-tRNA(Gln) amidotransferase subunit A